MVNIGDGSTVVLVTSLIPSHFSMCCFQIIDDFCSLSWTQTLSLKHFSQDSKLFKTNVCVNNRKPRTCNMILYLLGFSQSSSTCSFTGLSCG